MQIGDTHKTCRLIVVANYDQVIYAVIFRVKEMDKRKERNNRSRFKGGNVGGKNTGIYSTWVEISSSPLFQVACW